MASAIGLKIRVNSQWSCRLAVIQLYIRRTSFWMWLSSHDGTSCHSSEPTSTTVVSEGDDQPRSQQMVGPRVRDEHAARRRRPTVRPRPTSRRHGSSPAITPSASDRGRRHRAARRRRRRPRPAGRCRRATPTTSRTFVPANTWPATAPLAVVAGGDITASTGTTWLRGMSRTKLRDVVVGRLGDDLLAACRPARTGRRA